MNAFNFSTISRRLGAAVLAASALLWLAPQAALAQIAPGVQQSAARTANLTGVVVDQSAKPVAGATVQLVGPSTVTTSTDAHGTFALLSVQYGTYRIIVNAPGQKQVEQQNVAVHGDLEVSIQFQAPSASGLKTIASVSTKSAGVSINTSAASISSVKPTDYAFDGNVSWRELLNNVPGVTVGGGLIGGGTTNAVIPDSPFQPIILSINGALPYETSTTFDGMPLSNYSFSTSPGAGVDLSALPMPLFESADVVRGPGANAPSIVDSVGGSFVLHPPGAVTKNSLEMSISNDPYGGFFSNFKGTLHTGRLSATFVYGFNNSPGPLPEGPVFGSIGYPSTINGKAVAPSTYPTNLTNPLYQACYCLLSTSLLGFGGSQSTEWDVHNGGLGLNYQIGSKVNVQAFYAGSQATMSQAQFYYNTEFSPGAGYTDSTLGGGNYVGRYTSNTENPILQSGSLFEEKVTAQLGTGVLRLAALQNYTYFFQSIPQPTSISTTLWGTGEYCDNPKCTKTTPFAFNGQQADVGYTPFTYHSGGRSTNDDFLASYEAEIGTSAFIGASAMKSANSATEAYYEAFPIGGVNTVFTGGVPVVTQSIDEYRLHAGAQFGDRFNAEASYYIAKANYHVQNPADPTGNSWVDSPSAYSTPRLGLTYRLNQNTVIRASAGGGFALPPLFDLVGLNGAANCSPTSCTEQLTNINLQPEKSFSYDFGTDMRIDRFTGVSADIYKADLYGQLFSSQTLVGLDPNFHLPLYALQYLNLGHSRMEGINATVHHDVARGIYWSAGLGLNRGYIISVPAGFYDQGGMVCNYKTGAGCVNTYAVPGQNFNGEFQSTIPYANGSALLGYRWNDKTFLNLQSNYQGNNNSYFQPAFFEFDAHGSFKVSNNFTMMATFQNITGIYGANYPTLAVNPNILAPAIAGQPYPLYGLTYGPRAFIFTGNFSI